MSGAWEVCISVQEKTFKFAVCRLNNKNGKIEVLKAFQTDIPEDFCNSKNSANAGAVSGIVRKLLKSNHIKANRYNLCISDRTIITRVIKLPSMDFKDLKNFMKLSIQQYFPIKAEEYLFDYKIQSINENDEKAYYNVFLVAIPKAVIEYYAEIFLKCKMKPNLISIYSDVMSNLFVKLVGSDTAVMDMTYNYTEFIMLEEKNLFINSIINYAVPKSEEGIEEETFLKNVSVEQLGEDYYSTFETLKNYLNFFSSRHHGKSIEEVYIIGEGALMKESSYFIEENLSVKVKPGNEAFSSKITAASMPISARKHFRPEKFFGCFGLLMEGGGR